MADPTIPSALPAAERADKPVAAALDDARSARQPQAVDPSDDLFAAMVASLRTHIFGKGEAGIMRALGETSPQDMGRVIGEMVFAMVQEVAHQAEGKGAELDYDMLIGVATEVIDDVTELAEANGVTVPQDQREFALLYAQQLYVENQKPSDDQREAARQDLAVMKGEGMVDEATSYVQMRGTENGTDPFDVAGMSGPGGGKTIGGREKPGGGLMGEEA